MKYICCIMAATAICLMAALSETLHAKESSALTTNGSVGTAEGNYSATLTPEAARLLNDSMLVVLRTLDAQIALSAPANLSAAERKQWEEQTVWLKSLRDRLAAFRVELQTACDRADKGENMVSKMAQMNMQFLALQEATQMESRKFTNLTGPLKTRHDTIKNSINNLR
jgi:hypothetical protein